MRSVNHRPDLLRRLRLLLLFLPDLIVLRDFAIGEEQRAWEAIKIGVVA